MGAQRIGKSKSIAYIIEDIKELFGDEFPVFLFKCRKYTAPTEPVFWGDILSDFGHSLAGEGTAWVKRTRLKGFIIDRVLASKQRRIVIFIDEAQKLTYLQFEWLQDLYNDLDGHGLSPIFILVGQKQLKDMRAHYISKGEMQIVGRFMVHSYQFRALRNKNDIEGCLYGYDEGSEYPHGSGCSFTRHFFPKAFESGWRLEHEAEMIWKAFQKTKSKCAMPSRYEIPMQYFIAAINYSLINYANSSKVNPKISFNMWMEAIEFSGFADLAVCEANVVN